MVFIECEWSCLSVDKFEWVWMSLNEFEWGFLIFGWGRLNVNEIIEMMVDSMIICCKWWV